MRGGGNSTSGLPPLHCRGRGWLNGDRRAGEPGACPCPPPSSLPHIATAYSISGLKFFDIILTYCLRALPVGPVAEWGPEGGLGTQGRSQKGGFPWRMEQNRSRSSHITSIFLLCGGKAEREGGCVGYKRVELRETFQWIFEAAKNSRDI